MFHEEAPTRNMLPECHAMLRHALQDGKKIPAPVVERLAQVDLVLHYLSQQQPLPEDLPAQAPTTLPACAQALGDVHARLTGIIAPSLPRTVLLLDEQVRAGSRFLFLGPVPLVRRLMGVSIFCLFALLLVSLSPCVDGSAASFNFSQSNGMVLLQNYLFLITAAGLGASFAPLFESNKYVAAGTFDPKFSQSYWNRFLLGIMAGMILAFFIPMEDYTTSDSNLRGMGKPLLAMLGGFSSSAVYRLLNRIVTTLESFFKGDGQDRIEAAHAAAKAGAAREDMRNRMALAGKLTGLRAMMNDKNASPELKQALDALQHDLYTAGGGMTAVTPKKPAPPDAPPPDSDEPSAPSAPEDPAGSAAAPPADDAPTHDTPDADDHPDAPTQGGDK